jgi:ATP-binding cassette subfamily B multidrug efflux pump
MKIFQVGWMMSSFAESWGEVKEGLDDILVAHDMDGNPGNTVPNLRGNIVFEQVSFGYGEAELLVQFNLVIKEGERVGVVGRSGAGKSTLVKLLLRHYDVQSGALKIGESSISTVALESLRTAIAVIPQESNLFHRSLRENIAYGKPDATDEEVMQAAKLAEAHEFIEALPQGYETLVGERGVKLSGGQRQRVAIARAILKNAPILVLDEATSALDSESEVAIQKALHELMEGKTVIAIAHRLSTLREMDRIIVLDQGAIAEEGTHDELVKKGGIYARLWEHQAGGFLQE